MGGNQCLFDSFLHLWTNSPAFTLAVDFFFFIKLPELCEMRVQNVSTRDVKNHLQIKLRRVAHFDFRDHLRRLSRLSSPALFPEQHS